MMAMVILRSVLDLLSKVRWLLLGIGPPPIPAVGSSSSKRPRILRKALQFQPAFIDRVTLEARDMAFCRRAFILRPAFLRLFRSRPRWLDTEDSAFIWNAPFAFANAEGVKKRTRIQHFKSILG